MVVRGAPAIGIAAAYGVALGALRGVTLPRSSPPCKRRDRRRKPLLGAVAHDRCSSGSPGGGTAAVRCAVARGAGHPSRRCADVPAHGRARGVTAAARTVLTHCNAGGLATGGYGTAIGVIRSALASGTTLRVYADETRPYLQGRGSPPMNSCGWACR